MIPGRLPLRPYGCQGPAPHWRVLGRIASPLRPLARIYDRPPAPRWGSTIHDDEKSGHISAAPNESILFFNSKT